MIPDRLMSIGQGLPDQRFSLKDVAEIARPLRAVRTAALLFDGDVGKQMNSEQHPLTSTF